MLRTSMGAGQEPGGASPNPTLPFGDTEKPGDFDPDQALAHARAELEAEATSAPSVAEEPLPVPEPDDESLRPESSGPELSAADIEAADHPGYESADDPRIPGTKQYFKIGEVAKITGLKPYVLRYWEQEFSWLRPTKTSAGQRMYRRQDIAMILQIKRLRYAEHHTIAGAKEAIRESRRPGASARSAPPVAAPSRAPTPVVGGTRRLGATLERGPDQTPTPVAVQPTLAPKPEARAAQLGLGFTPPPRTAELVRRLADMRRAVLDLLDTVKE